MEPPSQALGSRTESQCLPGPTGGGVGKCWSHLVCIAALCVWLKENRISNQSMFLESFPLC